MIYSRHYYIHWQVSCPSYNCCSESFYCSRAVLEFLPWFSVIVSVWVSFHLWFIPLIARHVIHQFASCSSWLKTLQDCCTVVCWCVLALFFLGNFNTTQTYCILQEFLCASKATCNQTRTLGPSDTERKFEPWVLRQYRGLLSNWLWVIKAKAKVIIIPVFKAQSFLYEAIKE